MDSDSWLYISGGFTISVFVIAMACAQIFGPPPGCPECPHCHPAEVRADE